MRELGMGRSRQEETIRRYIRAYNAFDIDAMLAVLHDDVRFRNISGGRVNAEVTGKQDLERLARQSEGLFRTRSQAIRSIRMHGRKAVLEIDFNAVLAKDLPNGLKAGDSITLKGRTDFIFRDGLIVSIMDES